MAFARKITNCHLSQMLLVEAYIGSRKRDTQEGSEEF